MPKNSGESQSEEKEKPINWKQQMESLHILMPLRGPPRLPHAPWALLGPPSDYLALE